MIKYSTIKQLFKNEGLDLIQIHTPARHKKSSKHETSFFFKKGEETYNVNYNLKGKQINEKVVKEISEKLNG